MAKSARSVVIILGTMRMAILSLPAMFALSLSAGRAMNMKGRMEISLALSARPGTRGTKVIGDKVCCIIQCNFQYSLSI